MLNKLSFWKNFSQSEKNLYFPLFIILIISLLSFIYNAFVGLENVVHWDILSELNEVSVTLDQFKVGNETLMIPAKAYTTTAQFMASTMQVNHAGAWIFLGFFFIGFCLILASISALSRYYFLGSMGVVIFLLTGFKWELLFNLSGNYITVIILFTFGGLNYYFHAFRPDIQIFIRFIAFLFVSILLLATVSFFAKVSYPILLLASYRITGAMLLSVGFVFLVSYQIMMTFLKLISASKGSGQLLNFLVISLIYLGNVLLTFLHTNKQIDWDMIYISPFLLLTISIILGIWNFEKTLSDVQTIVDFRHVGAYLYLGLGIITFSTIGYAFATANDPMTEALEKSVTYTHLVMGTFFFLYILINFTPLLSKGMEVYKVVFKPIKLPFLIFRFLGGVCSFGILFFRGMYPLSQAEAGQYNAFGDYYTAEKDYKFAEIQYKTALNLDSRNHKSNYALASLSLLQNDNETAAAYFKQALLKNPSVFAYEGLARSFYDGEQFFDAMFTLREGLQKFPKSGELQNNMGYLHARTSAADSSFIYYDLAAKNAIKSEIPAANLLAFWVKNGKKEAIQNAIENTQDFEDSGYQANLLALKLMNEKSTEKDISGLKTPQFGADSVLSASVFAHVYNQSLFQKSQGKSFDFNALAMKDESGSSGEDLTFADIMQEYYQGQKIKAFDLIQAQAVADTTSKNAPYFQKLLNTLIKVEVSKPTNQTNFKTITEAENGLMTSPLDVNVLSQAMKFFNQNKQSQKGYDAIFKALIWRKDSPEIYTLFINQAFQIGMKEYAQDGMDEFQKRFPTDYQRFLPTYQAKLQSIEKANAGFQ